MGQLSIIFSSFLVTSKKKKRKKISVTRSNSKVDLIWPYSKINLPRTNSIFLPRDCFSYSSSSSSLSSRTALIFVHTVPRHCPHAGEQSSPCLRQLHLAEAQSVAQLQRIILRKDSGAAGRSVFTGITWLPLSFQPKSSNCIPSPRHCHCLTSRKTLRLWYLADLNVGGGSGAISVDLWLPLFRSTGGGGGYRRSLLVFLHTARLEHSLPLSQLRLELIPGCRIPSLALGSKQIHHIF